MRIRNPPTFIMSTSLIMSLIMTLLVFQCAAPALARLRRPSPLPPSCARRSPTDPSFVRLNGCVWRYCVARPCLSVNVYLVNPCVQVASYTPPTQPPQPKGLGWARRAVTGAAKS